MRKPITKWICLAVLCIADSSVTLNLEAAPVLLHAYISSSINDSDSNPLPIGSVIQIIGSDDNTISGFPTLGSYFVSNATLPGEEIIGTVTIDNSHGDGTFTSTDYYFDDATISYVYLRAFDTQGDLTGSLNWGYSSPEAATAVDGVATVHFVSGFDTSNQDDFVAVPEPGSGTIFLVFVGLLAGMRLSIRNKGSNIEVAGFDEEEAEVGPRDWI